MRAQPRLDMVESLKDNKSAQPSSAGNATIDSDAAVAAASISPHSTPPPLLIEESPFPLNPNNFFFYSRGC